MSNTLTGCTETPIFTATWTHHRTPIPLHSTWPTRWPGRWASPKYLLAPPKLRRCEEGCRGRDWGCGLRLSHAQWHKHRDRAIICSRRGGVHLDLCSCGQFSAEHRNIFSKNVMQHHGCGVISDISRGDNSRCSVSYRRHSAGPLLSPHAGRQENQPQVCLPRELVSASTSPSPRHKPVF